MGYFHPPLAPRHLDAAHAADAQVLQAMEEEKRSEERAERLLAPGRPVDSFR